MSDALLQHPHATTPVDGPVSPSRGTLSPIGVTGVRIDGGFWGRMQELNGSAIIRHCYTWMERLGWIDNFVAAVEGRLPKDRTGREFSDSDVYKLLEAMVWEMARADDAELAGLYEAVVAKIVAAQEADGYLNTRFGRPGQEPRYSDLEWGHELYCYGHLMQAAVARLRTHGEDDLVRVARRAADHVCEVFGPGAIEAVCGHAEVETALAEFARATGEARYLEQARIFVERRGTGTLADIEFGREYYQDDVPVRDAEVLRGHAVRAMYLAAGAIDVAVELEDDELLHAVERQLDRTVARRTYLTGGIGAHHEGESFGADWELPSERAYSETCASVGSMMTYHRMMLATGESRYADLVERNLYNVVATSTAEDGRSFFYTNTLHRRAPGTVPAADEVSPRAAASMRAPWFAVSCCPPNVARTLASLGSYLAATDGNAVYLAHYAAGQVTAALPGGSLTVDVETAYPHDGRITVRVTAAPEGGADVVLRVPAWAESGAVLTVRGESSPVSVGWARAESVRVGDEVVLDLPMAPRVVTPDPRIDALRGQVAVERGPLVLCLERSADADYSAEELRVAGDPLDSDEGVILPMVPVGFDDEPWPFGARTATALGETVMVPLIPYHQWGNHGPSTMRVWMPVAGH